MFVHTTNGIQKFHRILTHSLYLSLSLLSLGDFQPPSIATGDFFLNPLTKFICNQAARIRFFFFLMDEGNTMKSGKNTGNVFKSGQCLSHITAHQVRTITNNANPFPSEFL